MRRLKLGLALAAGGLVAAGLGVAVHARYRAPYQPVLEHLTFVLPAGHERLDGFRIGFVTDSHVGPFVKARHIEQAGDLLRSAAPDLVLFGGDYISESPRFASEAACALGKIAAAAPYGGIAVLGNHDLSTDKVRVSESLEATGIRVLRNSAAEVPTRNGSLWIVGVDETILGRADVDAAFASVPPRAPVIALWHEPDYADQVAARGAIGQLSGHSHGGQVRLPGIGPMVLPPGGRRYPAGCYEIGEMVLYTSRGLGVYRPPVRLFCPPEVTVVTLVAQRS